MDSRKLVRIFMYLATVMAVVTNASQQISKCHSIVSRNASSIEIQPIVVFLQHSQRSVTNGSPYGPKVIQNEMFHFNNTSQVYWTNIRSQSGEWLNVSMSVNETHTCTSSDFILIRDVYGNYNENRTCKSICFQMDQYYERYSIQVFHRYRNTQSLGYWHQYDYLKLYTAPTKGLLCHYRNETFDFWPHHKTDFLQIHTSTKRCPIGQGCRITYARRDYSRIVNLFIGCDGDDGQFGGCDDCRYNEYFGSPTYQTWRQMCRYCCFEDLCNSPQKCQSNECDLKQVLKQETNPSNAGNFNKVYLIVFLTNVAFRYMI